MLGFGVNACLHNGARQMGYPPEMHQVSPIRGSVAADRTIVLIMATDAGAS